MNDQEIWDHILLNGFKKRIPMERLVNMFFHQTERPPTDHMESRIDWFKTNNIKRTPRQPAHLIMTGARFVAICFPKLNSWLYAVWIDKELSENEILQGMKQFIKITIKSVRKEGDLPADRSYEKLKRQSIRRYDSHAGFRRSDWHIVKPTNARH